MEIAEIMTKHPRWIDAAATLGQAVEIMVEKEIRHLPVLDASGELVGILSERDARSYLGQIDDVIRDPNSARMRLDTKVAEVMQTKPLQVQPNDDVSEAITVMLEERVGALPVVDEHSGKLCGIVSYVDVLKGALPLFE